MLRKSILDDFEEIHTETMAIFPVVNEVGKVTKSQVIEENDEKYVPFPPTKIVDLSCKCYGSSLKGRIEGTSILCGITHKPPIIIDSPQGIYFFPTTSPTKKDCIWLSHSHIEKIVETNLQQAEVHFINGNFFIIDASFHSLQNQLLRASQYRFIVENRKSFGKRKDNAKQFINPFAKTLDKNSYTKQLLPFE